MYQIQLITSIYILWCSYVAYYYYFSNRKLFAQDRSFIYEPHENFRNIYIYVLKFKPQETNSANDMYNTIVSRLKIFATYPKSLLRREYKNTKNYTYSNKSIDSLISSIVEKIETIKDYDKFKLSKETSDTKNKLQIKIGKDGIIMASSHILYDGIASLKIISVLNDTKNDTNKLPKLYYIPLYNEIKFIINLSRYFLQDTKTQNISYDYDMYKTSKCYLIKNEMPLGVIKNFKKKYSTELGKKFAFATIYSAYQLQKIFMVTNVLALNIGILVAIDNPNRLNNVSVIIVQINRPKQTHNMLKEIVMQIHDKIEKNKYQVELYYSLTNIYNINIAGKSNIDIMFSGGAICKDKQFAINGIKTTSCNSTLIHHSAPISIQYISDCENIYSTVHLRTEALDRKKLEDSYKLD